MTTTITDVMHLLCTRASCRSFTDRDVPPALLAEVLGAASCAPTSFSLQPYSFVVVRDDTRRAALAEAIGNQPYVTSAPVFVVMCADLTRVEDLTGMSGELVGAEHGDALLNSVIDTSLAGMCLSLAAESAGMGTVMVGGVRNRPVAVAEILGLPAGVFALFGVCMGWPHEAPMPRPRLAEQLVVQEERYVPAPTCPDGTQLVSNVRGPADGAQRTWWTDQVSQGARKLRRHRQVPWRAGPVPPAGPNPHAQT